MNPVLARTLRSLQRNILAGVITIGPLFVTYLIFSFLLGVLAKAGLPVVWLLAAILPGDWLTQPWLQSLLAVLLTLAVLYVVGRVTSLVVGRQALKLFEALAERLQQKNHALYVESVFGEASTLEELEEFDQAYELFKKIENDYPAPNVIKIRMASIDERKKKKRK